MCVCVPVCMCLCVSAFVCVCECVCVCVCVCIMLAVEGSTPASSLCTSIRIQVRISTCVHPYISILNIICMHTCESMPAVGVLEAVVCLEFANQCA